MKRSRQANNPRYPKLFSTPSERGDIDSQKLCIIYDTDGSQRVNSPQARKFGEFWCLKSLR